MSSHWKPANTKLFGVPAFKHNLTGELALFGRKGQVFDAGDGMASLVLYDKSGTESMAKYDKSKIKDALKRGEIPRTTAGQREYLA